jgi:hypothetical protein
MEEAPQLKTIDEGLLRELTRVNGSPGDLTECVRGDKRLIPASTVSLQSLGTEPASWEAFYRKYPNTRGYVAISKPAFDGSASTALMLVEHWFGVAGLEVDLLLFKRVGPEWVIDRHVQVLVG